MDAARSILMTLGIVLHTANIYRAEPGWRLHDPSGGPIFDLIVVVIHTFRMPAFFIIAGFFCMLTLIRYGPDLFYGRRLVRIGVPLLFVGLVLNTIQAFVTGKPEAGPLTLGYWLSDGGWISHLWFLLHLIVYFTLVLILAKWRAVHGVLRALRDLAGRIGGGPGGLALLVLLLLPLITTGLSVSGKALPFVNDPILGLFTTRDLFHYGLFFGFGAILFFERDLLAAFSAPPLWLLAVILPAAAGALSLADADPALLKLAQAYAYAVTIWISCALVFFLFDKGFSRPSPGFMKMADASYTIYLLHHLLVILFGLALLETALPASVKFTLIVTVTFALTYGIHRSLVRRIPLLHFLLNGVYHSPPLASPADSPA
ncbi:MAG: acyltransferase family protein [Alphaproteobacteria bacterium]